MPTEEARRLATLRDLDLIHEEPSEAQMALFAATERLLEVDGAGLALVGERTTHLKMRPGWPVREVPRPLSFGALVMKANDLMIIEDTLKDGWLQDNPAYRTVRFLAGVPLRAPNGLCMGAFIAAHFSPRRLEKQQGEALRHLGRVAEGLVQLQALHRAVEVRVTPTAGHDPLAMPPDLEVSHLATALGLPDHLQITPEPSYLWRDFDPALVRLVFKKGAGEILTHLFEHQVARFKDLLNAIPRMNQRTLTTRLRELENRGLIVRRSFPEIPPRVEYSIEPDAQELVRQLVDLFMPIDGKP